MFGPAHFTAVSRMGVRKQLERVTSGEASDFTSGGSFAFVDTPLRANFALVVEVTALKQIEDPSPVRIVLTAEDAVCVFSKRSLEELCETTYSLMIESERPHFWDEVAVRISPSGAVHVSHNNRGWIKRSHVDPELAYHILFDLKDIAVLSMIGIATNLGEVEEKPAIVASAPPPEIRAESRSECVICYENEKNVAIKPCGHVALCEGCARTLRQSDRPECPICRASIVDILRLYFS